MVVCHKCDNPSCVNPEHLWAGTRLENDADRKAKGRAVKGSARLTQQQVDQIKVLLDKGIYQKDIAPMFGVCKSTVGAIARGEIWKEPHAPYCLLR
jgi:DNA-binding NarL/FixJ family response regulator